MKKLLMIFTMLMAASVFADTWTDPATGIEWTYTISGGEATVGDDGNSSRAVPYSTSGAIVIPSTLGGCPVTSIGDYAFSNCSGLTSVTIPSSVTSIGDVAFYDCGLTSVTIPSSVTRIGNGAFEGCSGLVEILVADDNRYYTSENGVLFDKSKTEIVAYPAGKSGHYEIPSSVMSIGKWAFSGCRGLTSVTIPSSVASIGATAFSACSGLVEILVTEGNKHYVSENGALFNKSRAEIVAYPAGKSGHYAIPSSVTSIGDFAFSGCSGLTSVTVPSSVTSIGEGAFTCCEGLTSVTIPSSVTSLGAYAFGNCDGLTSVTIPSSVASIGASAFSNCSRLTIVTISSSVKSIGEHAFVCCEMLTSVTIPSSVTSIGEYAFSACEALKTVYVEKGDTKRVKKMLEESEFDTSKVKFVEKLDPAPGPEEAGFAKAHTFGGLVTDEFGMCGMIQVATAKKSAKGEVKVSGFVMLEDGKKQTLKAVSGKVSGGAVEVTTKAGKTSLSLTITDDGFTGTLGGMAVASAEIGEETTGIISGTLKMSYFDAKTGKVKTKSIKISGLASGSIAEGTLTVGKEEPKSFAAEIE